MKITRRDFKNKKQNQKKKMDGFQLWREREVKIEKVRESYRGAGAQVVCSLENDSIATEPGASPLGGSKTSCVHIEKCREGKRTGGGEKRE